MRVITSTPEPLPLGYSGPHPLALVLGMVLQHVTADDKGVDEKCCRPYRITVDAPEMPPQEAAFKPCARRTRRGHKGSTS